MHLNGEVPSGSGYNRAAPVERGTRETHRTQGLEFRNRRSRAYFDKQISVPTYATNHSDPFAASAPPVEPTLLLTRPSRSPIFLINNIIFQWEFIFVRHYVRMWFTSCMIVGLDR